MGGPDAGFRQKQPLGSDMRHRLPSGKVLGGRKSTLYHTTLTPEKKAKTQAEAGADRRSRDLEVTTDFSNRLNTGLVTGFPKKKIRQRA